MINPVDGKDYTLVELVPHQMPFAEACVAVWREREPDLRLVDWKKRKGINIPTELIPVARQRLEDEAARRKAG